MDYKKETPKNYHKPTHKPVIVTRGDHRNRGNVHKPNSSNRNNSYVVNKDRRKENNNNQKYYRHNIINRLSRLFVQSRDDLF